MIDDHSSSSLVVPASTQDRSQGVLSAASVNPALIAISWVQLAPRAIAQEVTELLRQVYPIQTDEIKTGKTE